MTPIEEGEDVDESEVINVKGKDGVWRRYRQRKMGIDHMVNGKLSNNFYQGAVRTVEVMKMLGYVLGILATFLWMLTQWVVIPQIEKKIEMTAKMVSAPLDKRLEIIESLYAQHLLDVERRSRDFPTKDDLQREISDLREEIRGTR